ncbi:hypothetical protein AYK26_00650 [Euryarchaeota archaeon SM23-78]|nr:MAG: hypothetical protein AYK26_00650 [Euryarchaeota archaeon SM23-78]
MEFFIIFLSISVLCAVLGYIFSTSKERLWIGIGIGFWIICVISAFCLIGWLATCIDDASQYAQLNARREHLIMIYNEVAKTNTSPTIHYVVRIEQIDGSFQVATLGDIIEEYNSDVGAELNKWKNFWWRMFKQEPPEDLRQITSRDLQ